MTNILIKMQISMERKTFKKYRKFNKKRKKYKKSHKSIVGNNF